MNDPIDIHHIAATRLAAAQDRYYRAGMMNSYEPGSTQYYEEAFTDLQIAASDMAKVRDYAIQLAADPVISGVST